MKYGDPTPTEEEGTLEEGWGLRVGGGIGGLAGFMTGPGGGIWKATTKAYGKATQKASQAGTKAVAKNLFGKSGTVTTELATTFPSKFKNSLLKTS